jgi:hypothetical protein
MGLDVRLLSGVHPRDHQYGSAATFEQARAAFEAALNRLLPKLTAADFEEYHRDRAFHAWKYAMKDAGCTMPTATADGGVSVVPRSTSKVGHT